MEKQKNYNTYEITQEMLNKIPTPVFLQSWVMKVTADGSSAIAKVLFPSDHPDIASRWQVNVMSVLAWLWNMYAVRNQVTSGRGEVAANIREIRALDRIPANEELELSYSEKWSKGWFRWYIAELKDETGKLFMRLDVVSWPKSEDPAPWF